MLAEQDDEVLRTPVPQQAEEVLQVHAQLLATADGEAKNRSETEDNPDEARHAGEGSRELLARDGRAVDGDDVHVDAGEHEQGEDQLGEAAGVEHGLDEEAQAVVFVGRFPVCAVVEARGYDCAGDHADGGGDRDAEHGHEEDLPPVHVYGVVDVVVARHGLPGCRATVYDGDQIEHRAAEFHAVDCRCGRVVCVFARLREEDDEDDEEEEPCVALVD